MAHPITDLVTQLSLRQLSALRDRLQAEIRAFAEVWREASANDKLNAQRGDGARGQELRAAMLRDDDRRKALAHVVAEIARRRLD
jgi:hypothetical protein